MSTTTTGFTFAGTHAVTADKVRPADKSGTLILHGDGVEGVFCLCLPEVAEYAWTLIAWGHAPTATLDDLGNVVSVQVADGSQRVEFPKED